jgi:hypothetical protein
MEVSGHLHVAAALPRRKKSPVPIEQKVGWAPQQIWAIWGRKTSLATAGNLTPYRPARSIVTILTELSRSLIQSLANR